MEIRRLTAAAGEIDGPMIAVANAPCSWGVLEFESTAGAPGVRAPRCDEMLDELTATGYAGTELGDWGFLPTDPRKLGAELARRGIRPAGAFVPVELASGEAVDEGIRAAVRTARLLAASADASSSSTSAGGSGPPPVLVLADRNGVVPSRVANAGRIQPADGLEPAAWERVAEGTERIARAVASESGLRTAFHHHCAGYVETPGEIEALISRVDPSLVGLCLDTGHAAYGGGDPLALLARYGERVWHVHFKDCSPEVAARARAAGWDYFTALRHGLFCELGRGSVDFAGILAALGERRYTGWIVVEQDVLPGRGTPEASARRNREHLRALGV